MPRARPMRVLGEAPSCPPAAWQVQVPRTSPGWRTRLVPSLWGHHTCRPKDSGLSSHAIFLEVADVHDSKVNGQRLVVEMGAGDAVGTQGGPGRQSPARNEAAHGLRDAQICISQEANEQDAPLLASR